MNKTLSLPALLLPALLYTASAGATEPEPASSFTVGGGIGAGSRYSGSDEYQAGPILLIDYQHDSGFYASTMRGIGYAAGAGPVRASLGLGYRGERSESNTNGLGGRSGSKALRGMGDVKGSAVASLGVEAALSDLFSVDAHLEVPLSRRESGKLLSFGPHLRLLDTPDDQLGIGLSLRFGDRRFLQTWYGVGAAQSLASGYRAFTPRSGLHGVDLELGWTHRIDEHWSVTSALGVQHLVRDAAKSPIVRRRTTPTAAVFVSYRF
jgi:outer membrane protein